MKRPLPKGIKLNSKKGRKVFSGIRFDVYQWKQKQFDGTIALYETIKRKDTVVIFPVMGREVYILNERQPHWEKEGLCAIAGGIEKNEDPKAAAKRELLEETGMVFKNFYLVSIDRVLGFEWFMYVFVATGYLETREKKLDRGEKIEAVKVNFNELIRLTRKKEFFHPPRFIEKYIIEDKIPELFDLLENPAKYKIKS